MFVTMRDRTKIISISKFLTLLRQVHDSAPKKLKKRKDKQKTLKFIHITKTAGTSIENVAKMKGIPWGRFDEKLNRKRNSWHYFLPYLENSVKCKYDWFMVVRDPYDRLISEFHCRWGGAPDKYDFTPALFNLYIRNRINNRSTKGGHYSEQNKYLDEAVLLHVLKFENLENDFENLMIRYGIDLKLNRNDNSNHRIFTKSDFDSETMQLIKFVYKMDFLMFGYER